MTIKTSSLLNIKKKDLINNLEDAAKEKSLRNHNQYDEILFKRKYFSDYHLLNYYKDSSGNVIKS